MGRKSKQTFLQGRHTDGKKAHKRCSASLIIREMQIKTIYSEFSHWSKWQSSKNLQVINAGKGVKKREPFYYFGGDVNWYKYYGEQCKGSLEN